MEKEFFERLRDLLDEYIGNSEERNFAEKPEFIGENPEDCGECPKDGQMVVIKQEMPIEDAPDEIKKLIDFVRGGR